MQRCGFELFDLDLAQLKSSSFSVSMVSFVTFQSVPFFKRISERLGKKLNVSKLEICVGVHGFLSQAFLHFYIAICSCMLLEDVLEILPLLMPKTFINQFVFVWGHE
jgi:hypothetical protein